MSITICFPNGYREAIAGCALHKNYPGCNIVFKQNSIVLDSLPQEANSDDIRIALEEAKMQPGLIKTKH